MYPFQDGILNIVKKSGTPFYLTGGTAISRGYFNHRYSDDLDLFVNQDNNYASYVQILFGKLESAQAYGMFSIDYKRLQKYENYTQFFLKKNVGHEETELKIDIVNDVASHYKGFENHGILGKIDSWQNILSNKLSAVFRYEAKDIADIWIISKYKNFNWISVMQEAKTKEAGIDPIVLFNILRSFPENMLSEIKWITPVQPEIFKKELNQIADDILQGNDNTLFSNSRNIRMVHERYL
ncbi:nucleotidyl transferase AbiEii/AbiGii toxin family protein [Desulfobacterales bacterium HSG17]|nr:nucleotidyl transferase AbiEii/AbiGii toxin family protein [Desulfobacterales bacterium HSG17]